MARLVTLFIAVLVAASLAAVACTGAAPAPTVAPPAPTKAAEPAKPSAAPTTAPAAPTKAPEATKPAAPTAASTVAFPEKGRAVNIIVPWAAGSSNDVFCRLFAPYWEKELGTTINVVSKAGGGSQTGLTELALAKPDGYTIGLDSVQTTIAAYIDPERQAAFNRNSFAPIALTFIEPTALAVTYDSPFKNAKELVEAARAKPKGVSMGDNGLMSGTHQAAQVLQMATKVQFNPVHFGSSGENTTALLGGHVQSSTLAASAIMPMIKDKKVRLIAMYDQQRLAQFPDVPTLKEQGYDAAFMLSKGLIAPAATPKEIVAVLESTMKKAHSNPEFQKKADEGAMILRWMDSAGYGKHMDEELAMLKVLIPAMKAEAAGEPTK